MTQPTCETCRWWPARVETYGVFGLLGPHTDGSVSECRKNAPSPREPNGGVSAQRIFPTTARYDWCGEYQPREHSPKDKDE